VQLDEPRGDDAHDPRVPALARDHEGGLVQLGQAGALGLAEDSQLRVAPLVVHAVELLGHRRGAGLVGGGQELERGIGAAQAAGGVQPRAEAEAQGVLVHSGRIHARLGHQGAQAGLARPGHPGQARAHDAAVLAPQRHQVAHRPQRGEVQVVLGAGRVQPGAAPQRLRQLERHAGGAQLGERVAADGRVQQRAVRQLCPGPVVVGHEHVHPGRPGRGDLGDRGDAAVHCQEEADALAGQALDSGAREAVALVVPAGELPGGLRPDGAQRVQRNRSGADAVHVVVAEHENPGAALDVVQDQVAGALHPGHRKRVVAVARLEEGTRRRRVPEPAAREDGADRP
jgi:hypothetical protein